MLYVLVICIHYLVRTEYTCFLAILRGEVLAVSDDYMYVFG